MPRGAVGPAGTGTQTWLRLKRARCPHDGSPQPQKQQAPGTTPGASMPGRGLERGHRGAGSPGNSPGSVLGRPQHPPCLETTTALLPSGHSGQLPIPTAKGGCSWLQSHHHHSSPPVTFPRIPAGSQPCFSSKLEAKNSPGGAGRKHGMQTGPCEPSWPPPHPSWGVPGPSPRTPGRSQPQDLASRRSPLPAMAAPGSPRVPGWATP